jgi:hypothetical protein
LNSAYSKAVAGSGFNAGRSISSNHERRLPSSFWNGRSFRLSRSAPMAALSSGRLWKRRWRSRARIQRSTSSTPASTFALSRGL